jgi:carbon storage regulator
MLVLTRRVGEEIVIGENIRVAVVLVRGHTVRLGISAPTSVRIARLELLPACEGANRSATAVRPEGVVAQPRPSDGSDAW